MDRGWSAIDFSKLYSVHCGTVLCTLLFTGWFCLGVGAEEKIDFTRDVRPIFSENCFHCHGFDAKARKADLRMDDEASVRELIVPGAADQSELIGRLEADDPDDVMPPPDSHRSLTQGQIDLVRRWIDEGAQWGGHWAFEPIPEITAGQDFGGKNPVDYYIDTTLAREKIQTTDRAPRHTLIRRASLDLTGLPPTPEEVIAFENDSSGDAWSRVVDRLLESPHFGERMAWDWLNAARYADTNGYQGDRERTMWPWRDWVVDAFNRNLPFDHFTVWQLAGDLLPEPTDEQILASGFNRNHMINGEGGRIAEENRVDYVFDMTETMGTVWLGLTLNCCRCHDHKFDPLKQQEYYQLTAFFNQTPVTGGGGNPQTAPVLAVPSEQQSQREKDLASRYKRAQKAVSDYSKTIAGGQAEWEKNFTRGMQWRPLKPISARANEVTLSLLEDHSVLASGANPDRETHVVDYGRVENVTAIKLDALQHESFTNRGKGLARSDSGNFVLTEIEFRIDGEQVSVVKSAASQEQGGLTINRAYDGNRNTGWAVLKGRFVEQPHHATFILSKPVSGALEVTLRHDSVHKHHYLGRFRVSATDDPFPRIGSEDRELVAALRISPEKRNAKQKQLVAKAYRLADPGYNKRNNEARKIKAQLDRLRGQIPKVMVMQDLEQPRKTYMLDQGLYDSRGEEVTPAVPGIFDPVDTDREMPNRLDLARWLTADDHPLTARVTVNRLWQMIFGTGLVKTVEDFGVQSEYPVHPELLDWMAAQFIESGWDVKRLLRTILLSEAYRRSSKISSPSIYEADPENRLLARGVRYRMPSWMIRDQALAISGLHNTKIGGPGFNGYQPPGIWEEATFGKKKYIQAEGDDLYRRSLYVFWRRIVGPTMFFASAKRQVCEVKQSRTNTPMHALATLNDVTYVEAARHLAEDVLRREQSQEQSFHYLGRKVLARAPAPEELEIWRKSLQRGRAYYTANPDEAESLLAVGDSDSDESLPKAEYAALTHLCLMLLNLDETLNRE